MGKLGDFAEAGGGGGDEFELQLRSTGIESNGLEDCKQQANCCNDDRPESEHRSEESNGSKQIHDEDECSDNENDRTTSNQHNNQQQSELNSLSDHILSNDDKLDAYLVQNEILTNSIKLFRSEFRRLGFSEKHWRYTSFNKNFTLCSTYPPYFIVPAQFVDEDLVEVAKFRHMGRLPALVYRHRNGAVIVRSSQPSVGLLGRRSIEDERLLQLIFANCVQDQSELLEKSSASLSSILNEIEQNNQTNGSRAAKCDCCDDGCAEDQLADNDGAESGIENGPENGVQNGSENDPTNDATNGDTNGTTNDGCSNGDCSNGINGDRGPDERTEEPTEERTEEDKDHSANSNGAGSDSEDRQEVDRTAEQTNGSARYPGCSCSCHQARPEKTSPSSPTPSLKLNSKNCQPTSQGSKFFSLPDKILENLMSYTGSSYTPDSQTASTNRKLLILDARSFTVAFLNRAFGGGSECSEYYPNCEVDFLYLANIHAVRTAFFSLKALIRPDHIRTENNQYYFSNWSKSNSNYWLYYISNLIESALKVVQAIDRDARPVLVHCSDGWDRTAQISSLAELMLDPFYRTMQGFKVLVQREWLDFGHKFADRCGVNPVTKNVNERSPIFIQWLDCVYQIVRQCPDYFEFNCTYLEELALHTYSPLFGTFSCNSYLERFINQIHGETTSVWSYLEKSRDKFINENYIYTIKVPIPSYTVNEMCIWRELYTKLITDEFESRFDMRNAAQMSTNKGQFEINNVRKKKLFRTNSFLCQQQQQQTKNSTTFAGLRRTRSDSELLASQLKERYTRNDEQPPAIGQPNGGLNFSYADRRLDPQPGEAANGHANGGLPNGKPNGKLNGKLNGKSTCKFESSTCESEKLYQHQLPLSVISKIAQIANNNNPDSSLMYSLLTYVNTLHTFSVK